MEIKLNCKGFGEKRLNGRQLLRRDGSLSKRKERLHKRMPSSSFPGFQQAEIFFAKTLKDLPRDENGSAKSRSPRITFISKCPSFIMHLPPGPS